MSENVDVKVKGEDKGGMKAQVLGMKELGPDQDVGPRRPAKLRAEKAPDQTVRGGQLIRPHAGGYVVVNAENEIIPGKVVVDGPNGTLEIEDE